VEVCKVFEFFLQNAGNLKEFLPMLLMPMGLVWSILEGHDTHKKWIVEMMNSSQYTKGFLFGNKAFGFDHYAFPKSVDDKALA